MQGMYACRSAPKLRSREASARSKLNPKLRRGAPSGVSAGSCCPHHVAARHILKQPEQAQAVFFYACRSTFPQIFCVRKRFAGALKLSHKTRCAIFAGALKLSHKTRCAIFAGALSMSAMINEKLLSAVGSRGRRAQGMPACRSIPMPRRTRAAARSRVKSGIGDQAKESKAPKLRSREASARSKLNPKLRRGGPFRGFGGVLLSPPHRRKAHYETA